MIDVMQFSSRGSDRHPFLGRPADTDIGGVGVGDRRRDDRAGCC